MALESSRRGIGCRADRHHGDARDCRIGLLAFVHFAGVPAAIIIPVVTVLRPVGAYPESRSVFAVGMMVGSGLSGDLMHRIDYSRATALIGFVVGA